MGKQKTPLVRQLANIDLRLLRIFKTVADCGGFSNAQGILNITTSTISNYMSDLEQRLGLHLCHRGRGGFSLTEQGRVVYEATEELLEALEQFRSRVSGAHHTLLGELHLAIAEYSLMIPENHLVDALRVFNELAPEVRLQLSTMTDEDIPGAVLSGEAQLGISVLHKPAPNLLCQPLFQENMSLYCGRGHRLFGREESPEALQELNQSQFMETSMMRSGGAIDPLIEGWKTQATALQLESRVALLLTGKFVGYLPDHLANQGPWANDLQRLFPQNYGYQNTYQLLMKPQAQKNPVAAAMVELLNQYCSFVE